MANQDMRSQTLSSSGYSSYFKPLVGKYVTVYRGGPESKSGILLDVKSDYMTVAAQNNNNNNNNNNQNNQDQNNNANAQNNQNNQQQSTVVYYNLQHVKSVTEDSLSNSAQNFEAFEEELEFIKDATSFAGILQKLKDTTVQINQGGPEKKSGLLLDVLNREYIVLLTEDDGVVYFNIQHIKSISEYNQQQSNEQNDQNTANSMWTEIPEYMKTSSFNSLFSNLSHKWVSINVGGPEAVEGVLVESKSGSFTLVQNQQVLRLQPRHVKTISVGAKGSLKQQNNNQKNNQNNNNANQQTEVQAQETNQEQETPKETSSSRTALRSNRAARETVMKTKDYRWKV